MRHYGIRAVGDLSRVDRAGVNRLPIISPKISHAKGTSSEQHISEHNPTKPAILQLTKYFIPHLTTDQYSTINKTKN
jgi:hypothetical protein